MKKGILLLTLLVAVLAGWKITNGDWVLFGPHSKSELEQMDTDNDGVSDYVEEYKQNTKSNDFDSDGDGLLDFEEINGCLASGSDMTKPECTGGQFTPTDPTLPDTDRDGIADFGEVFGCRVVVGGDGTVSCKNERRIPPTDPQNPDTDGDGLLDGEEQFGCTGEWDEQLQTMKCNEIRFTPTNPHVADTDDDSRTDIQEIIGCDRPRKRHGLWRCDIAGKRTNPTRADAI